ncbi:hypothetical protein ABPG74_009479 [Tetrahymena malaccensis]
MALKKNKYYHKQENLKIKDLDHSYYIPPIKFKNIENSMDIVTRNNIYVKQIDVTLKIEFCRAISISFFFFEDSMYYQVLRDTTDEYIKADQEDRDSQGISLRIQCKEFLPELVNCNLATWPIKVITYIWALDQQYYGSSFISACSIISLALDLLYLFTSSLEGQVELDQIDPESFHKFMIVHLCTCIDILNIKHPYFIEIDNMYNFKKLIQKYESESTLSCEQFKNKSDLISCLFSAFGKAEISSLQYFRVNQKKNQFQKVIILEDIDHENLESGLKRKQILPQIRKFQAKSDFSKKQIVEFLQQNNLIIQLKDLNHSYYIPPIQFNNIEQSMDVVTRNNIYVKQIESLHNIDDINIKHPYKIEIGNEYDLKKLIQQYESESNLSKKIFLKTYRQFTYTLEKRQYFLMNMKENIQNSQASFKKLKHLQISIMEIFKEALKENKYYHKQENLNLKDLNHSQYIPPIQFNNIEQSMDVVARNNIYVKQIEKKTRLLNFPNKKQEKKYNPSASFFFITYCRDLIQITPQSTAMPNLSQTGVTENNNKGQIRLFKLKNFSKKNNKLYNY